MANKLKKVVHKTEEQGILFNFVRSSADSGHGAKVMLK